MNTTNTIVLTALAFALTTGLTARADQSPAPSTPDWITDHLEVGTRATYFWLRDDKRPYNSGINDAPGSFYGSINELKAQQDYLPIKAFVDYKVNPYFGAELTWDQIYAKTWTQNDHFSDGTVQLLGPEASLFVRCPTDTRFTPYAGAGLAYFFANFDENSIWHNPPGRGELQTMDLDNSWGWLVYGGCNIAISGPWSADVMVRYTKADTDGVHYDNGNVGGYPHFPMSNISASLGVRYSF